MDGKIVCKNKSDILKNFCENPLQMFAEITLIYVKV